MSDLTAALCFLLSRAHFARVPTTRLLWTHVSNALDAAKDELSPKDLLRHVLDVCLKHPLNSKAPRDPKHFSEVWNWLTEAWHERGWPVPESLCSFERPEEPKSCPELCYKTYIGWGGCNKTPDYSVDNPEEPLRGVTLLESSEGIVHHTTGLTTWGGAAMLANWITDYPHFISGKRVLELGSGVGFTTSVILTSPTEGDPPPVSYIATDCHHHVLTLLHHNLELNLREELMEREELESFQESTGRLLVADEVEAGQIKPWSPPYPQLRLSPKSRDHADSGNSLWTNKTAKGTEVQVLQVDWRDPCPIPEVDVILAADVVYAHHLIPPLVSLIKSVLTGTASKPSSEKKKNEASDNNCTGRSQQANESGELLTKNGTVTDEKESEVTENSDEEFKGPNPTEGQASYKGDEEEAREGESRRVNNNCGNGEEANDVPVRDEEFRGPSRSEGQASYKEDGEDKREEEASSENSNYGNGEGNGAPVREAYIACTRRSHETMGIFLEEVLKQDLVHSLVYQGTLDTDTFLFIYNETHVPVRIYKLTLPN